MSAAGAAEASGCETFGLRMADFTYQAHGVFEIFFGLARETNNDVGRDGGIGDLGANTVEDAEELFGTIRALHCLEDRVRARLQRHVKARHDRRRLGHRVDDVVGERGGVGAREANAFEALDLAGGAQELAECELVAELDTVCVDVLPEERDFDRAVVNERLNFAENLAGATVFFLAAKAGVVMTSESEEELVDYCDRIVVFFRGRVVKVLARGDREFTVDEIYRLSQGVTT